MRRGTTLGTALLFALELGCTTGVVGAGAPPGRAEPAPDRSGSEAKGAMPVTGDLQAMVRAALADAGRRVPADAPAPRLLSAERVTWPDGSLGCPMPGRVYTMALVRGFRIRIQSGASELDYHAGERGLPFVCPPGRSTAPLPGPGIS